MHLRSGTVKAVHQALQQSSQSYQDTFEQMCRNSNEEFSKYVSDPDHDIKEDDLITFIRTSNNRLKKTSAYLRLIETADLDVLKRLIWNTGIMSGVDYTTPSQFVAVLRACEYGRVDVLRWLVDEMGFSIHMKGNRKKVVLSALITGQIDLLHELIKPEADGGFGLKFDLKTNDSSRHPVMLAIKLGNLKLLRELVKPKSEGGFGLSLNVRDELDYGPAMQAALAGEFTIFQKLMQPVSESGFDVPASRYTELRNFPYDEKDKYPDKHAYLMTIQHSRIAPNRCETLTVIDMEKATTEVYKLGKCLGGGTYGQVYEFNGKEKKFAVKLPNDTWSQCFPGLLSEGFLSARKEFSMVCQAYPDEGPYALQSLRRLKDGEYFTSWRIVMPFIPGKHISTALKDARDPLLGAKIILESMKALEVVHSHGVLHSDIRPGNILINMKDGEVSAHLIDFGFASLLNVVAQKLWVDTAGFFAPERIEQEIEGHPAQDIWSLARTFEWCLKYSFLRKLPEFPAVNKFIENGLQVDPALRQPLSVFINMLQNEIHEYASEETDEKIDESKRRQYVTGNRFFMEDKNKKMIVDSTDLVSMKRKRL